MAARENSVRAMYEAYLRKRPKQSRSRGVVEAVLEAGAELVARGGGEQELTLQQVAERAGVGIGSLYDYFRDRGSVLAGLAAKVTEDNLRDFQAELARSRSLELEELIGRVVDLSFERYLRDRQFSRSLLRIALPAGLMPTLAESQSMFARALAAELRARSDVHAPGDAELTAYAITNMTLGMILALVWVDDPPFALEDIKQEIVRVWSLHLRGPGPARP